ncbi:type II secretion system protein [Pseudoduganella rivuli]|uniref:type II secretion system protein n=1 Tax=Pseudoduganella rivuli TaxID=2666085 RepID=UPI001E4CE5E3|nr:type II secretion system protein [Pseudoduganella rivuli]
MRNGKQRGFTYLSLVILVAIIGLISASAIKLGTVLQRSAAERELLAIGAEYADALESYAKATPPGQSPLPPSFKELLRDSRFPNVRRHLRRVYVDPLTGKAEWGIVYANNAQGNPQMPPGAGVMPGAAPGAPAGTPGAPTSALSAGMTRGTGAGPGAAPPAQSAMQPQQGGTAGIIAIYSLSTARPVKVGNFPARFQGFENRSKISDWKFARAEGQAGQPQPVGQPPQPGQPSFTAPSEPPMEPATATPPPPQPEAPEPPEAPPADAQPQRHGEEPPPEEPPQETQPDKNKTD